MRTITIAPVPLAQLPHDSSAFAAAGVTVIRFMAIRRALYRASVTGYRKKLISAALVGLTRKCYGTLFGLEITCQSLTFPAYQHYSQSFCWRADGIKLPLAVRAAHIIASYNTHCRDEPAAGLAARFHHADVIIMYRLSSRRAFAFSTE